MSGRVAHRGVHRGGRDPCGPQQDQARHPRLHDLERLLPAAECGVAAPTFSSALSYYDGYRSPRLPANLLQAQRDYFGAHTYERTDKPRGEFFHTNWTGRGGTTASTTYNA